MALAGVRPRAELEAGLIKRKTQLGVKNVGERMASTRDKYRAFMARESTVKAKDRLKAHGVRGLYKTRSLGLGLGGFAAKIGGGFLSGLFPSLEKINLGLGQRLDEGASKVEAASLINAVHGSRDEFEREKNVSVAAAHLNDVMMRTDGSMPHGFFEMKELQNSEFRKSLLEVLEHSQNPNFLGTYDEIHRRMKYFSPKEYDKETHESNLLKFVANAEYPVTPKLLPHALRLIPQDWHEAPEERKALIKTAFEKLAISTLTHGEDGKQGASEIAGHLTANAHLLGEHDRNWAAYMLSHKLDLPEHLHEHYSSLVVKPLDLGEPKKEEVAEAKAPVAAKPSPKKRTAGKKGSRKPPSSPDDDHPTTRRFKSLEID